MSTTGVLDAVQMTGLALVSVGLWTLRVALTARGRKITGATTAAVEASVFALVFARLVADLDQPSRVGGYAVGVAIGTLLGISAHNRISRGYSNLRMVVPGSGVTLFDALRRHGWPVTALPASGLKGEATVLFVTVDDTRLDSLVVDVRRLAPDAFWTVERLHRAAMGSGSSARCRTTTTPRALEAESRTPVGGTLGTVRAVRAGADRRGEMAAELGMFGGQPPDRRPHPLGNG